jgi:phytanoyl-CoA hydroxylase
MAATLTRTEVRPALAETQRRQYEEDGFFVVEDLLMPTQVEALKERVDLLARHRDNRDAIDDGTMYFQKIQFVLEPAVKDGAVAASGGLADVRKMGQVSLDPVIMETLALNPKVLPLVRALLGPDVRLPMSALFAKPSGHGSETPWHQDQGLWKITLPTAVSCWVALDECTRENGCLQMVPGSHKGGLVSHVKDEGAIHPHLPSGTVDERQSRYVEMRAGSGVFFTGTTWHYSAPNASEQRRLGIVCVYVDHDEFEQACIEGGQEGREAAWALRGGAVPEREG